MTPSKGCTSEYSDELVLNKEKLWYPDLCRVKGLPCCCSSSTTHCPQYDDQEPGLGRRISLLPLAFLPLPTNSLSRKCELWRNFSNIFHSENVFSLSPSVPVSGRALVKRLSCILFVTANLWKCPPAAAAAYFSLPCINSNSKVLSSTNLSHGGCVNLALWHQV